MKLSEFKLWFEGYYQAIGDNATAFQLKVITDKLNEVKPKTLPSTKVPDIFPYISPSIPPYPIPHVGAPLYKDPFGPIAGGRNVESN